MPLSVRARTEFRQFKAVGRLRLKAGTVCDGSCRARQSWTNSRLRILQNCQVPPRLSPTIDTLLATHSNCRVVIWTTRPSMKLERLLRALGAPVQSIEEGGN